MPMRRRKSKSHREPTIALINVVFLMLVFFMVAGSLAPSMDPSVRLVEASDLEASPPPDALVIRADGSLSFRGAELTSPEAYVRIIWEEEEVRKWVWIGRRKRKSSPRGWCLTVRFRRPLCWRWQRNCGALGR